MITETLIETIIKSAVILGVPLGVLPLIIHVERRGAAFIQKRLGPNRVGPFGLLQPLADVVKFMFKEEVIPSHVRKSFYVSAPILALVVGVLPLAGIPLCGEITLFGKTYFPEVFRSDLGIFFAFAMTALGSYGVLLAGWASNNKYSMLGALRASAQMISYELSMSLSIIATLFIYSTGDIHQIVNFQAQAHPLISFLPAWGVLLQPVACILFIIAMFAESNRLPFDLAEGESELVAGFHVEYSSMKFAMFFMAEYIHMIVLSMIMVLLFFGGYNVLPGLRYIAAQSDILVPLTQIISFLLKVGLMIWFFIWVRWSIPRFRYDQLMSLGWKLLLPIGMLNLIATVLIKFYLMKG